MSTTRPPTAALVEDGDTVLRRTRMVAELAAAGEIPDPAWQQVFAAVPRHVFVPAFYRSDTYREVRADDDSPEWLDAVYSDETLVTRRTSHTVTSSGTMPSLVSAMVHALAVTDGNDVLQVGTGTGYTAALLCQRLGSEHVVSVDVEPALVDAARPRLARAGHTPTLVTGDGAAGHPPRAPYDRVLATCAVPAVPPAWIEQTVPGARIVAPLRTGVIALDRLDAPRAPGAVRATGRFLPVPGYFMPLRPGLPGPVRSPRAAPGPARPARPTLLGPRDTYYRSGARFVLALALPGVHIAQHGPVIDDLLVHDDHGSSATLHRHDDGGFTVAERGPRRLWAETEHWCRLWQELGEPPRERFGVSVTDEKQWFWLDHPESAVQILGIR